ncbi:MAG: hypothetical protein GTO41_07020 [Burkholderiales bacterium]|nr:hypothetical protein [Burkholderiales bacterium]
MALAEYSEAHVVHAWKVFCEGLLTSHMWDFSEAEFEAMLEEEAAGCRRRLEDLVTSYGILPDMDGAGAPIAGLSSCLTALVWKHGSRVWQVGRTRAPK